MRLFPLHFLCSLAPLVGSEDDFLVPEGITATIFADHKSHSVTSPTSLTIAEDGTLFLTESSPHLFRNKPFTRKPFNHSSFNNNPLPVADELTPPPWILDNITSRSPEDRRLIQEKWRNETPFANLTKKSAAVRRLQDHNKDGHADKSSLFADGFDDQLDGAASGVFAYEDVLYFACVPNIWALSDLNKDGKVSGDERLVIQDGFGVRLSLSGHDLSGFTLGPDGRIYGTMGDRAMSVTTAEGTHYPLTNQGAAFRFEPDGSDFEIFHTGLRNPTEIAFNEVGDPFSVDGDNSSGKLDELDELNSLARLVYLVEGADSGWRSDHQTLHRFHQQIGLTAPPPTPWLTARMSQPANPAQPSWLLPPIANLSNHPTGLAFQPGTALGGAYQDHFFLCDDNGQPAASDVHAFTVQPEGASYQLAKRAWFAKGLGATDIAFGNQGTTYLTGLVASLASVPQGRVIALNPDAHHPQAAAVEQLMREGFRQRSDNELINLLAHPDQRVRLRAQLALVEKPQALTSFSSLLHSPNQPFDANRASEPESVLPDLEINEKLPPDLYEKLLPDLNDEPKNEPSHRDPSIASLHATWGIAILARKNKDPSATAALIDLLKSPSPELRAQAAKALGETPVKDPTPLINALTDPSDRVRFFAALSLGRLRLAQAFNPLLTLALYAQDRNDPYLRHAAVSGLTGCASEHELLTLSGHALPGIRLSALLALRRLKSREVNRFLFDHTPDIRHEAIRIIHDTPIETARPALLAVVKELLENKKSQAPPAIWRRLIHSTFRLSGQENAARLLTIARTPHVPLGERKEALRLLLQWREPHPVDQSLGRYAPLSPRPLSDIRPLLELALKPLLQPDSPLFEDALALLVHYRIAPTNLSADTLLTLTQNEAIPAEARSLTLQRLAHDQSFPLNIFLIKLLNKKTTPITVKLDALALLSERQPQASFPYLSQALYSSHLAYRQGAALQLATHTHPEVPLILVAYFDRLREKDNPDHSIEIEMTLAAKVSAHHAAHDALQAYQDTQTEDPLAPFLASLHGGNASQGADLFANHPVAQCSRCHATDSQSNLRAMSGPNLSNIGVKSPRHLLEALIKGHPSDPLRENLRLTDSTTSIMPIIPQILPPEEIRDLVAYLTTLTNSPSSKKPLAQEPKRHHPSSKPNH